MKIPPLPLNTSARELVEFCLLFRTPAGFIGVYEEKLAYLSRGKRRNKRRLPLKVKQETLERAAYEQTEQLYYDLFTARRYADCEVFQKAKSRFYKDK